MSTIFEKLFSLRGKTALVTGASGGIGRVIAMTLAEAGAVVGLNGTNVEKLEAVRKEIAAVQAGAVVLEQDLQSVQNCRDLLAKARAELGRVNILVNCAGVNRRKPILKVSEEDFDYINNVNLKSLFFLAQGAADQMRALGGGKIINVGSITSTDGLGGVGVYGGTKAAVAQLTKTMALEWARYNIQVNCLAPGFMMTALTEAGLFGNPHRRQWILDRVATGRPGKPEELAGAILLLASDASSYLTGQIVNVDGGYLAGGSWLTDDE
jgi:NAD(P)-dependent dehydrogenase (short-subunit alcohol dehydrogenase family)